MACHPGPEAAKHPQTMLLPPPCFMAGIMFLYGNAVFGFYTFHLNQKVLFGFIFEQNILPAGFWLVSVVFIKLQMVCSVLFAEL